MLEDRTKRGLTSYEPMPVFTDTGRTFAEGWWRVMRWADLHLPRLRSALNPPASQAEIDRAEASTGLVFSADFRALYRAANGEHGNTGLFFGLTFLSLDDALEQRQMWMKVVRDFPALNSNDAGCHSSTPIGAIAEIYASSGWIPIAHDNGGNHLAVDLDPGPDGRLGQIINYGRDEDAKFVIAPSLASFLNWCADNLEIGNFRVTEGSTDDDFVDFAIAEPPNEHFLDAVREMGQSSIRPR